MKITVNQIKQTLSLHSRQVKDFFDKKTAAVSLQVTGETLLCLEHAEDGYIIFLQDLDIGKVSISRNAEYVYPSYKLYVQTDLLTKIITGHLWESYYQTVLLSGETVLLEAIDTFSKQQTVYKFPDYPEIVDFERAVNGMRYMFMAGEFMADLPVVIDNYELLW